MEIERGIQAIDLALYVKGSSILIISDVHIGYEEALNKQGMLMPRFQLREIYDRLGKVLLNAKPETIIITGDLKHEFGTISDQEWRDTLRFLDFLGKHAKKIVLLKGNHDTILGPIAKKRNVEVRDYFSFKLDKKNAYACHGDAIPSGIDFNAADIVIIGHEHPAITIRDDFRAEKFKCFLKGKWKGKTAIVMPSLNLVSEGTDVQHDRLLSPFLQGSIGNFEAFVVGREEVLAFGRLKDIK